MTRICPYCRTPIDLEENRLDCQGCNTPHHADCFAENGGCTVFGCSEAPADEPKLTVSGEEAAQVANPAQQVPTIPVSPASPSVAVLIPRSPSVLGLDDPLVLAGTYEPAQYVELSAPAPFLSAAPLPGEVSPPAAPPPPPPSGNSTNVPPPPPPPGVLPGVSGAQPIGPSMSAAEYYANFHPPRSRVTYVLLGVFLGALGIHNFYAGYVKKAVAQLCISLFTCFYGSIVSWIWAVFEVCTVHQDSEGVQFS